PPLPPPPTRRGPRTHRSTGLAPGPAWEQGGAMTAPPAPDPGHRRPPGVDDATVAAVGKVSEALEWLERARGRLYDFHQMLGHLDLQMEEAATMLRDAGHEALAERLEQEVVGRNVLDGRWTFQIVEEFEGTYYDPIRSVEQAVRDELME